VVAEVELMVRDLVVAVAAALCGFVISGSITFAMWCVIGALLGVLVVSIIKKS
jgi:hypothetical protein